MALACLEKVDQLKVLIELNGWFDLAEFAWECKNYDSVHKMLNHALYLLDKRELSNKMDLICAINDMKDRAYKAAYEV